MSWLADFTFTAVVSAAVREVLPCRRPASASLPVLSRRKRGKTLAGFTVPQGFL